MNSFLSLDIGTSSIKACVLQEKEGVLKVQGFSVIPQHMGNLQGGAIIHLAQTINNVHEAVKKAENMARISPKDLIIGLSSEMVKGMTVRLQFFREEPDRLIDDQELKSMIYELHWQAFDLIRKNLSDEMCVPESELKLLNACIMNIRVDDQVSIDPRGLSGTLVEMDIFHCFSPAQHFGNIQTIAVEMPYHELKGVFIPSFAVAYSLSLRSPLMSAVIIDIGAGVTDVSVIIEGRVIGNRCFSMGGNSFTKRISHELSSSFEEAESIKIGYCDDTLDKKSAQIIREAIHPDMDLWISSLHFSLKELPIRTLPSQMMLCGNGSFLKEFSQSLEEFPWNNHFPMDSALQVRRLHYSDIVDGESVPNQCEEDFFPLIAVSNTAHDLLYGSNVVESILNGIIADKSVS